MKVLLSTLAALGYVRDVSYFHLLGGQLWAYEDVKRWLVTAGCANVRRIDSPRLPGTSIVLGSRIGGGGAGDHAAGKRGVMAQADCFAGQGALRKTMAPVARSPLSLIQREQTHP